MLRCVLMSTTIVMTAIATIPFAALAATPADLKSVTVHLPVSDQMFTGPGSDTLNNNCLTCHSADMVLNQPALPKAAWAGEVDKMARSYKAPVAQEDVSAIVDYLARIKGAN
jgi:cytochrome c5